MKPPKQRSRRIRQISTEQLFTNDEEKDSKVTPSSASDPTTSCSDTVVITGSLRQVSEQYSIVPDEIGFGHYGIVRRCLDRRTGEMFAIKSIPKSEAEGKANGKKVSKIESIKREVDILTEVRGHPSIIRHFDTYEDDAYVHLVTEMCTGGMLFDKIVKRDKPFPEREATVLVRSILNAVVYLHDEKNIVHRDIKPENFLFETDAEDSPLKLIDFGLSRTDPLSPMKTSIGTAYYVAPEVLDRHYTKSCDLWSVGVVCYMILCGYYPFYGDSTAQIIRHVKSGIFDFPAKEWDPVSSFAKDFVCSLLQTDPHKRLTAAKALQHKWICKHNLSKSKKSSGSWRGSVNALKRSFSRKAAKNTG